MLPIWRLCSAHFLFVVGSSAFLCHVSLSRVIFANSGNSHCEHHDAQVASILCPGVLLEAGRVRGPFAYFASELAKKCCSGKWLCRISCVEAQSFTRSRDDTHPRVSHADSGPLLFSCLDSRVPHLGLNRSQRTAQIKMKASPSGESLMMAKKSLSSRTKTRARWTKLSGLDFPLLLPRRSTHRRLRRCFGIARQG